VNELSSKLKSAEVDRGMTAKIEGPTDSHSLTLIGGSKGKTNTNPSTRMFSLSSLMTMPDEEFDVLGEDELALLTRRFERLHENRVNMRRNTRTCFQCGKPGHFVAGCPEKAENKVLTPKIGTGKRLTCGPGLVRKHHSAGNFPQSIR
jgi:hypothetical protein